MDRPPIDEETLRLVRETADRQKVEEILYKYCRACDRLDLELMESCFWPDATAYHGAYNGPAEGFWRGALHFLSHINWSLHYAMNVIVEVDGDIAYQEAIYQAWHRVDKGPIHIGPFETGPYAGPDAASRTPQVFDGFPGHDEAYDEDAVFHGRYVNRFQRRGNEWRILNHVCFGEWTYWRAASERAPQTHSLATRDRSDPAYWRKEHRWGV